jgi:hypothetical protein
VTPLNEESIINTGSRRSHHREEAKPMRKTKRQDTKMGFVSNDGEEVPESPSNQSVMAYDLESQTMIEEVQQ